MRAKISCFDDEKIVAVMMENQALRAHFLWAWAAASTKTQLPGRRCILVQIGNVRVQAISIFRVVIQVFRFLGLKELMMLEDLWIFFMKITGVIVGYNAYYAMRCVAGFSGVIEPVTQFIAAEFQDFCTKGQSNCGLRCSLNYIFRGTLFIK